MQGSLKVVLLVVGFIQAEGANLSRIIGGVDVDIADHPWQVSLRYNGGHSCGGSFLSSEWVITAAHCVANRAISDLSIGYGDSSLSNQNVIGIVSSTMHPSYTGDSSVGYPYDYAVLRLASSVDFGSNTANAINMAEEGIDLTDCTITGWGCANMGFILCTSYPDHLQGTPIIKITPEICKSEWGDEMINEMHVCVKEPEKSACSGDSGGPLMCYQSGNKVLAGVTSWGSATCSGTRPSVYSRVSFAREWISEITGIY